MDNYIIKPKIQIQIEHYNYKTGNRWVFFIYNNIESKYNKKFGFKKWKVKPDFGFLVKKRTYFRIDCHIFKKISQSYDKEIANKKFEIV